MQKKKNSGRGIVLAISLLLSVMVFILLVVIAKAVMNRKDPTKSVVVATCTIAPHTVITEENAREYFEETVMDEKYVYDGTFRSLKEMFEQGDLYTVDSIMAKEIIAGHMVMNNNRMLENLDEPVEMGIRAKNFSNAAGGVLRRGDLVDLCVTDDMGIESSVRTYILQAFDNEGQLISSNDAEQVAVAFNILIEREDYSKVAAILEIDSEFDMVKINNVY